jgi:ferrous iron transport protein B
MRAASDFLPAAKGDSLAPTRRIALLGNPNTGKTTLFNRLCGVRARTANFPGSTVEVRLGTCLRDHHRHEMVDLPGIYGLDLNRPESKLCSAYLAAGTPKVPRRDCLLIVVDATNLARNLVFVDQCLSRGLPAVVALNMIDLARRQGLTIDNRRLSQALGCPVVPVCARTGEGLDALVEAATDASAAPASRSKGDDARAVVQWAQQLAQSCEARTGGDDAEGRRASLTDRLDGAFTHPVLGLLVFAVVMSGLFFTIFTLASVPMDLIELVFAYLGQGLSRLIGPGAIHDLVVDGVVAGVAGVVVFVPQICLLFFLISLLEDTGYLARAAFVMDRLLRRFGLPGQSFVPLLSAHACALPAIMSARLIPDQRDRLATILVAPFMSCSARLPVYVLLISLLFAEQPLYAGLAFTACYGLGAVAALLTALLFRRTILRGPHQPMVLELPTYKLPSLRNALLTTIDRATVFLRKAGTVILAICIVLWWLSAYPRTDPPPQAAALQVEALAVAATDPAGAAALQLEAERVASKHALAQSFAGRIGHVVEPAFRPLGYDWQLSVGVLTSFAAREVFVSTMAVLLGAGDDAAEGTVVGRITTATRDGGEPIFTTATAASLLVFYVLAMQCLPTLAVTRRETGSWKWAGLQLGYMTAVAYAAAFTVYKVLGLMGGA